MKAEKSYAFFRKLKPSLQLIERMIGRDNTAFTQIACTCITSAVRLSAHKRKPVQKAQVFDADDLEKMFEVCFIPVFSGKRINPAHLRALLRAYVVYYCFTRLFHFVKCD